MISKTLQLSNNRIAHYFEQGEGEPLVLIHGVGMQAAAWYPQIEYFSKHYRVISVDMPGHGKSTKLADGAPLKAFVDWAIEFITALNLGAVNLAGHSMGSLITTGVSATRPDLVKRMAVLNGVYKRTSQARDAVVNRAEELKKVILMLKHHCSAGLVTVKQNKLLLKKSSLGWKMWTCLDIPQRMRHLHMAIKFTQMTGAKFSVQHWF